MKKERVDILLCEQGLCESREEAKKLILAGLVLIDNERSVKKSSELISSDATLHVKEQQKYVSRGAYKLLPALEKYLPDLSGMTALDIGASTGGFTDLMLQKGAERVYAVDVGYGQLHYKLRKHPRVVSCEKINARYIKPDFLPAKVDILTMDVSFISVTKILPAATLLTKPNAWAFILVKPQFETEKENVKKGGVVRDETIRKKTVRNVIEFMENKLRGTHGIWRNIDIITSTVKTPKGNAEYMTVFKRNQIGVAESITNY